MSGIEDLKEVCMKIADGIEDRVREERRKNFGQFGEEVEMGADGTPTQHVDKVA